VPVVGLSGVVGSAALPAVPRIGVLLVGVASSPPQAALASADISATT
jgi:hypothetical protein